MKFQMIICMILMIGIDNIDGVNDYKKLSKQEKTDRIKKCGKQFFPRPSPNQTGQEFGYNRSMNIGLLTVKVNPGVGTENERLISSGFVISDRHVLTSTQSIFTSKGDWNFGELGVRGNHLVVVVRGYTNEWEFGVNFTSKDCRNHSKVEQFDVPVSILKEIQISNGEKNISTPVKGTMLLSCNRYDLDEMYAPLLLEIPGSPFKSLNFPCLADEYTDFRQGDFADMYGLDNGTMQHHRVKLGDSGERRHNMWLYPTSYVAENDRGGPMIWDNSGTATVIGLKGSTPGAGAEGIYVFNLVIFQEVICQLTGICGKQKPKPLLTTQPPELSTSGPTADATMVPVSTSLPKATTRAPSLPITTRNLPIPTRGPSKPRTMKPRPPKEELSKEELLERGRDEDDNAFFVEKSWFNEITIPNFISSLIISVLMIF